MFCTVLRSKSHLFLQFPLGIVKRHAKKKKFYCWLKIYRARRKKWEVLNTHSNVHFPRKVPNFRACKNAKFALQHPIIFWCFGLTLNHPKDWKRKNAFSWEMKSVSGHLKFDGARSNPACSLRPLSDIAVKAKISIVTRRGFLTGKIFVGMRPFSPQKEQKTKKELLS